MSAARTPVFKGHFGKEEAERLLWRAGFGPRQGEAAALAKKGLKRAVYSLTRPRGRAKLAGPTPHLDKGEPLAPYDAWGNDHLWWFDRMVRSTHPLEERMTLVWHDWFATSNDGVGDQRLMLNQNALFRRYALGSFAKMLPSVASNPAMLVWLSGNENTKWAPNENYAREQMELFTLGTGHYTERDVREHARALTGFTNDWRNGGYADFHFSAKLHDFGIKRIFRKRGNFSWRDSCDLCINHRAHADFFVRKLWSYFVPTDPPSATVKALKHAYVSSGHRVRPVVEAILMHPALYKGPRMVKPPVVYAAGMLRARGGGVTTDSWVWVSDLSGQQLFYPPNVAGWNDDAWLDTGTFRGRWIASGLALDAEVLDPDDDATKNSWDPNETAAQAVASALAFWGGPTLSSTTLSTLTAFAQQCQDAATAKWQKVPYRIMRQNALRKLIVTSPDMQTS